MRRAVPSRAMPLAARRFAPAATLIVAVFVVALVALLMSGAVRAGGPMEPLTPVTASGLDRHERDRSSTVRSSEPAEAATAVSVAPLPAATTDATSWTDPTGGASDLLLRVQPASSLRALSRLGPEGRLLAGILAGLLLAIVGRRPRTRHRPVLVPLPAAAAPGLRLRRRGPPPR